MFSPGISIIIPAYNAQNTIEKAINSCLRQSFIDFQLIVVNDGSQDNTAQIVNQYAASDPRVELFSKQNEGVNIARKCGIELAKGNYVFFMDSDDSLPEGALESLMWAANQYQADIVAGDIVIKKLDGISVHRDYHSFGQGSGLDFLAFILENWLNYLWGKLIKRELYLNNAISHKKELHIGEDQIHLFQLCGYSKKVVCIPQVVYNYEWQMQSVTQSTNFNRYAYNQLIYSQELFNLLNTFSFDKNINKLLFIRILVSIHQATARVGSLRSYKRNTPALLIHSIKEIILSKYIFRRNVILHVVKGIVALIFPGGLNLLFRLKRKMN